MKQTNQQPADGDGAVRRQLESVDRLEAASEDQGGSRLASVPQAIGDSLGRFGRQLKDRAAQRAAAFRSRLENQAEPDAENGANGVRRVEPLKSQAPDSEGMRPVRMQPSARDWRPAVEPANIKEPIVEATSDSTAEPAAAQEAAASTEKTKRLSRVVQPMGASRLDSSAMNESSAATATYATDMTAIPDSAQAAAAVSATAGGEGIPMSGTYIDLTQPSGVVLPGGATTGEAGRTGSLPGLQEAIGQTMRAYRKRRAADRSIRRNSRERVYRLKGYTTVAKVNHKFASERRQRLLRRILTLIIISLTLILLFQLYNPIRDLSEWYRIIGIDSLDNKPGSSGTSIQGGSVTVTPPAATPTTSATTSPTTTKATTRATTRSTTRRR